MRFLAILVLLAPPAFAQNVHLTPAALPASEPAGPALYFGPADVAALEARTSNPAYSGYFSDFRAFVDGRLGALAANGLDDDTKSRIAKAAALLHQLGETPPGTFSSYRDVAVKAFTSMGTRKAGLGVGGGADTVDVLLDSPRLQSLCEAWDFLRGTGVSASDEAAMKSVVGAWASALVNDVNLTGVFGVGAHRDNWGIKASGALISCAMSMTSHADAKGWFDFAMPVLNDSLAAVASSAGWYRESPHYVNYAFSQLIPAAYAVKNRTGRDWFPELRPLVEGALAMRQPDGQAAPFEEGVANVFPFDVVARAYPDLTPQLLWAWRHSAKDPVNFDNQAMHSVTRFLVTVDGPDQEPPGRPSRFLGSDSNAVVLRGGWDANAAQLTQLTARDHSTLTLVASRHNMQNPLDFVYSGAGQQILVTASGGPEVTKSANRSYYLSPSSKNVPLILNTAPFVADATQVKVDMHVATRDDGGRANRLADFARTKTTAYTGVQAMTRFTALVDRTYGLVADEMQAPIPIDIAYPLHVRGTRTVVSNDADLARIRWDFRGISLDASVASTSALAVANTSGYYAPAYGTEEAILGVELRLRDQTPRTLTMLHARAPADGAFQVTDFSTTTVAALRIERGNTSDLAAFGPGGGSSFALADVNSDATFTLVRKVDGALAGFAVAGAGRLVVAGNELFSAGTPTSISLTLSPDGFVAELSADETATFDLKNLPGIDLAKPLMVLVDGKIPPAGTVDQTPQRLRLTGLRGGTVRVQPNVAPALDAVADATVAEGQPLVFALHGSDPDATPVRYTMSSTPPLPAEATLDENTGAFAWTPGFDVAKRAIPAVFQVVFTVSDGVLSATRTATLTVTNVNRAPTLTSPGPQRVHQGETLTLKLAGADADAEPLTWKLALEPAATRAPALDAAGTLTWMPDASVSPATYHATVTLTDTEDTATATFDIEVLLANRRPVFTKVGGQAVEAGKAIPLAGKALARFQAIALATDPEGEDVAYSLENAPAGLTIDAETGLLDWKTAREDAGDHAFAIVAKDPEGLSAKVDATIHLEAAPPLPAPTAAEGGCGCGTSGASALLLLGLAGLRRRRGST